jgi:hypothetical protein
MPRLAHMRTMETTYNAPNRGVGTMESVVPEVLRKLGRVAVWIAAGSQFIDVIWCAPDDAAR